MTHISQACIVRALYGQTNFMPGPVQSRAYSHHDDRWYDYAVLFGTHACTGKESEFGGTLITSLGTCVPTCPTCQMWYETALTLGAVVEEMA